MRPTCGSRVGSLEPSKQFAAQRNDHPRQNPAYTLSLKWNVRGPCLKQGPLFYGSPEKARAALITTLLSSFFQTSGVLTIWI